MHIQKQWTKFNKQKPKWGFIQYDFRPRVFCILIRLRALRQTYHFNDQANLTVMTLSYPKRKYPKDKAFWYRVSLCFYLTHNFYEFIEDKVSQACWGPWEQVVLVVHLGFLAMSPPGVQSCAESWTFSAPQLCFVCSISLVSLLYSFHDIWHGSPFLTLGWWNKLAESVDTISVRSNWACLIQSQKMLNA